MMREEYIKEIKIKDKTKKDKELELFKNKCAAQMRRYYSKSGVER